MHPLLLALALTQSAPPAHTDLPVPPPPPPTTAPQAAPPPARRPALDLKAELGPGYVRLMDGATEVWRIPAPDAHDALVHGDKLYVAAGRDGLYVYALAPNARPTPVAKKFSGHDVVKLLEVDGNVYALERRFYMLPAEEQPGPVDTGGSRAAPPAR